MCLVVFYVQDISQVGGMSLAKHFLVKKTKSRSNIIFKNPFDGRQN